MTRYIVDSNAQNVEDLKNFNTDRYILDDQLSTENKLVFTR